MIVKASTLQRRSHRYLINHLGNASENEQVILSGSRGLFASSLAEAIEDLMLMTMGAICSKPLLHTSISPSVALSEGQWAAAWSVYEQEFNLANHAYVEVTHTKAGRSHRHRVYSRICDDQTAIDIRFNYLRQEKVARMLENGLNLPLTLGRFNRAVIKRLEQEGQGAVAAWMIEQEAHLRQRPSAVQSDKDTQQQKRSKVNIQQVRADLQTAWQVAIDAQDFLRLLLDRGYILARGNRRDYVVCDWTGNAHSPRRRLDVRARELRVFLGDLIPEHLPTVDQVQQVVKELRSLEPAVEAGRGEVLVPEQEAALQQFLMASGLVKAV